MKCQRSKVHRHNTAPLGTLSKPDVRFDKIHIDLVGPLPPSNGCVYILTCVDRFTRWPEAIPIPDSTADMVARAFVHTWISRFGTPSTVTTDRGRQFESHLWKAFTRLLGTKHLRTTAYHPMSNGLVERLHRQLKASIKSYPHPEHLTEALPLTLLGIRSSLKEDIGCTSAELVYGTTLRLPGEFFVSATDELNTDPGSYVMESCRLCNLCVRRTPVCTLPLNPASVVIYSRHLMSLCVMMQSGSHSSRPTMVRLKFCVVQTSIFFWTSTAARTQYQSTDSKWLT